MQKNDQAALLGGPAARLHAPQRRWPDRKVRDPVMETIVESEMKWLDLR